MGLDTTHDAWHGPYGSFNDFRREIIKAYNGTDLFEYEGYEMRCKKDLDKQSPQIPLTEIDDDGLFILANHSDCDGDIRWVDCKLVADSIELILKKLPTHQLNNAIQFIKGCRLAHARQENLLFH